MFRLASDIDVLIANDRNTMRTELDEQAKKASDRGDDMTRFDGRREALDREARFRITELQQKSALRVQLRLPTVLVIQQPKLLVRVQVESKGRAPAPLELVWDPLVSAVEAAPCPTCTRPTFAWAWTRQGKLVCT